MLGVVYSAVLAVSRWLGLSIKDLRHKDLRMRPERWSDYFVASQIWRRWGLISIGA